VPVIDSTIQTADDAAGLKYLRMFEQSVAGKTVEVEAVAIVDPADPNAFPLGSLADAETVNSTIGLLKRLISRLVGNLAGPATIQAVPTSTTALIGATCAVLSMIFANTTGAAIAVTVTDGAGSPVAGLQAFSIPANSILRVEWGGVTFTGGVKWSAGGAGVNGAVIAYQ
jgi:hypothetical protein